MASLSRSLSRLLGRASPPPGARDLLRWAEPASGVCRRVLGFAPALPGLLGVCGSLFRILRSGAAGVPGTSATLGGWAPTDSAGRSRGLARRLGAAGTAAVAGPPEPVPLGSASGVWSSFHAGVLASCVGVCTGTDDGRGGVARGGWQSGGREVLAAEVL